MNPYLFVDLTMCFRIDELVMNLARWRKKRGLKQWQVAAYLTAFRGWTVTQSQVAYWEKGAGMSRSTKEMLRLALAAWETRQAETQKAG